MFQPVQGSVQESNRVDKNSTLHTPTTLFSIRSTLVFLYASSL